MGVPQALDTLTERASFLRESIQKSQTNTESMVSILGSFDHRLSALESAMRPTQVRTHAFHKAHESIGKALTAADVILGHFDLSRRAEAKILRGPGENLESYLEAVDQLRNNVQFFISNKGFKSSDGVLNRTNTLLAKAMLMLEEEFKQSLSSYSKPMEPDRLILCLPDSLQPSSEMPGHQGGSSGKSEHQGRGVENVVCTPPALIPPRILPSLHGLAQEMVQAGRGQECLKIYRETRGQVLEQSLRKLGVEKFGKEDVQKMPWETLEAKIGGWIHYMRIAVKLLFAGERKVCDKIFEGMDSLRDQCFAEVSANSLFMLLSFGEAIAESKRLPHKLFVLLDMYEIMRELQSEIEILFEGKAGLEMRESALSLTKHLAQTAQETFADFEEAVEKDATKTAVQDGTVHSLTSYVINYVKFLFDYQSTLRQLFLEFEDNGDRETNSKFASVTMRIMQVLQENLEGKSKQYKDPALSHLFLMNNINYIVRSVRKSEAKDLLGDDWVQRHRRIVQKHAQQYQRISWSKILQCLNSQTLASSIGSSVSSTDGGSSNSGASKAAVKERFRSFNMQFEELHQRQSQWTVPEAELRDTLKLKVAEILIPAYRSFYKRFSPMIDNGKNHQRYIRYTADDLERILNDFFEGKSLNEPRH
ncbi:hypothetical protein QJS10_CPA02g01055 [Acorus calamus]|uniref:Exocyst subunit Exo70 family protein n=1 Tax=Acorus calamus TaxID=4465 RepID=A0AAV9FAZ1_ACOCL|nr:hypothetical protein QJS10_CPA02g01055 [Acorus calamus]